MERFFIIGCQRTGTTLLRLVLECHAEIACYDERRAYKILSEGVAAPPAGKRRVGFKIPRWTEQLGNATLCDEGLEEKAAGFYRGEPILFLLRDARDTVASMLKLKVGAQSWLEVYGPAILEAKMRQPAFRRRYGREIAQLRASGNALALVGALYWKFKTQAYFDYRDWGWPVCGIPYEGLVVDPESHLRRVVAFLRLAWDASLLEHPRFPHGELFSGGATVGNTDPTRAIHADSVGQWQHLIGASDAAAVLDLAGDVQERLRYGVRVRAA
jgi:hypothetical protein